MLKLFIFIGLAITARVVAIENEERSPAHGASAENRRRIKPASHDTVDHDGAHAGHDHEHGKRGQDQHRDDSEERDEHAGHDDEHAGHDGEHAEHDDGQETKEEGHGDEGDVHEDEESAKAVSLSPEVLREFEIDIRAADGGRVRQTVRLPGEVVYNSDRIADIMPSVVGIIQRVDVSVGDRVKAGQVLAVLRSRELAVARSDYLAAKEKLSLAQSDLDTTKRIYQSRLALARSNLDRDQSLFDAKVVSERIFLETKQYMEEIHVDAEMAEIKAQKAIDEAKIRLQQAETSLHALGLNEAQIKRTEALKHGKLSEYDLLAPFNGIVTKRDLTIGEVVEPTGDEESSEILVVADLSTVWVDVTVYQRDLARVRAGQPVEIKFGHGVPDAEGEIAFVSPALNESTRTAFARVVLDNPEGHWRPGLFVECVIETGYDTAAVVVPRSAVIGMKDRPVVFVESEEGLEPRPVRLGRGTDQDVEILDGLRPGERFAATNVLTLKAQFNSGALKHAGHSH